MSEVKVNKVSPRTGTDVTVGGKLITESNGDLNLYPNGTGAVEVGGNTNPGTIILNCESNSHGIKLQSPAHSAGQSYTLKFPTGNVTADTFLKVDSVSGSGATGIGQLSFGTVSSDLVKISEVHSSSSATNVDITLDTATYDRFQLYWWSTPASDGYSVRARWIKDSTVQTGSDYNSGHFGTTSTNNYYSNVGENQDHFRIINNAGNEDAQGHHFNATISPRKSEDLGLFGNVWTWFATRVDSSNNFRPIYGCAWYNGTDYEPYKIRLYMESGDFSKYSYTLYGIK